MELPKLQNIFPSYEEEAALHLMLVATALEDGSLTGFVGVDGTDRWASNVLFKVTRQSSTNHQVATTRFVQRKVCREDSGVVIAAAATGDVEIAAAAAATIDAAGSRGGASQNELVPCSQTQGPRGAPKPGSVSPVQFHGTGDGREGIRLLESLVRASVRGSTHKVSLGKWNKWLEFMKRREGGRGRIA